MRCIVADIDDVVGPYWWKATTLQQAIVTRYGEVIGFIWQNIYWFRGVWDLNTVCSRCDSLLFVLLMWKFITSSLLPLDETDMREKPGYCCRWMILIQVRDWWRHIFGLGSSLQANPDWRFSWKDMFFVGNRQLLLCHPTYTLYRIRSLSIPPSIRPIAIDKVFYLWFKNQTNYNQNEICCCYPYSFGWFIIRLCTRGDQQSQ